MQYRFAPIVEVTLSFTAAEFAIAYAACNEHTNPLIRLLTQVGHPLDSWRNLRILAVRSGYAEEAVNYTLTKREINKIITAIRQHPEYSGNVLNLDTFLENICGEAFAEEEKLALQFQPVALQIATDNQK